MSLFRHSSARRSFRSRLAFTLAEVSVVTGVVLGGGGNAAYMGVQKRAYRMECQHNLEQIARGLMMFEIEHGSLPNAAFYPRNPKTDQNSIRVLLSDYGDMFVCPCMPSKLKERGLTFLWNDAYSGRSRSAIPNPSQTWLLVEMSSTVESVPHPHQGGFNILYADLHVRWTKTVPPDLMQAARRARSGGQRTRGDMGRQRQPRASTSRGAKAPRGTAQKAPSKRAAAKRKPKPPKTETGATVFLKNGRAIKGVASWKEEGDKVIITMKSGMKIPLPKANIKKIVKGDEKDEKKEKKK